MKIVLLDTRTIEDQEKLEALLAGLGTLTCYETTTPEQRTARIGDAEIVITNKVVIDREVMDACPAMRLICIAATGMNNVDREYAREKGISVKNVSGYSTESVAQHTFSMLLHLLNRPHYYGDYVRQGLYSTSGIFTHIGPPWHELKGKRFGIIGLGTIGKRVAAIATAFGCEVVYYSTSGKNNDAVYRQVTLEELLDTCDVVSVHAPLNDRTRHLLGEKELTAMKASAVLLNAGRGGIIDEAALARALDERHIYAAGLDVFEKEPIEKDNPLLQVRHPEHLLLTPHIAWTSREAREKLLAGIVANIRSFLK